MDQYIYDGQGKLQHSLACAKSKKFSYLNNPHIMLCKLLPQLSTQVAVYREGEVMVAFGSKDDFEADKKDGDTVAILR